MKSASKIIFIVGPTAVGKSKAALTLAREIKGEIVSCDAMQVYREINIASNKPSPQELKSVPHHLVNVVSVEQEFNVSLYSRMANAAIKEILAKGKTPIIVGGSGLYVQVLLDGLFNEAPRDEKIRQKILRDAEQKGWEFLYKKLEKLDSEAALKIHPNNHPRLIRALEVCLSQSKKFTALKSQRQGLWGKYDIRLLGLDCPREELYQRINARVEEMFRDGLVEEIEALKDVQWSETAAKIIGVKEVRDYFNGKHDLERAKYLIQLNTRHYAKRQLTWFRKEKRLVWVNKKDILRLSTAKE